MSAPVPTAPVIRWTGTIDALDVAARRALLDRSQRPDESIRARTAEIVSRVRRDGDAALRALATEYDRVELEDLEVPRAKWARALDALPADQRRAMERAAANIETTHRAFAPVAQEVESEEGILIGRRPDPLRRVGVYAPGGRAAYPSSVLMGVIPARVAGVGEICVCSPPARSTGLPSNVVLAAAALAGAHRLFSIGGAGAIAAMAFGTGSVPRVDRIVGPGNAWVAAAKLQVATVVAIDSPAGPSELLVLADDAADPALVARELLAQAEHDPAAAVVALVSGAGQGRAILEALTRHLAVQPRADVIRASLATRGAVLSYESLAQGVAFANDYAPEHLLLAMRDPDLVLADLRNAGTIFVGASSSVAFGDYMTGANHVLPTGGLARSYSGLSTLDFVRWTTWQRVSPRAAASLAGDVGVFADAEGLPGHALAARAWLDVGAPVRR